MQMQSSDVEGSRGERVKKTGLTEMRRNSESYRRNVKEGIRNDERGEMLQG